MPMIKVASRFMLPLEMLLGCLAIVSAAAGSIAHGTLWHNLAARGENLTWFCVFFSIGAMQVGMAAYEWTNLRGAAEEKLLEAARVRSSLQFMAVMAWVCSAAWLIIEGLARSSMMFLMTAPIVSAFAIWAFIENQKVSYALDPRIPTRRLRFHR